MPSSATTADHARSGIETTSSGERHIPQSVRPDGSIRKEIKVRPGYRPPEDVEVYKNRTADAWKTRGSGGVPGAEGLKEAQDLGDAAKGKNAKRREARRKAKTGGMPEQNGRNNENVEPKHWQDSGSQEGAGGTNGNGEAALVEVEDETNQKEKQARNLNKKLRQAKELKEKNESGESLLPEQFAKVIKIQELIRQLDALGFDSDGGRKTVDSR